MVSKCDRKKRRKATTIGAVLALTAILLLVGIVSALQANLSGSVVSGVLKSPDILWSSGDTGTTPALHPPLLGQRFCTGAEETLTPAFTSSADHGQGLGMTTLHSDIVSGCNIPNSALMQITYDLTAAEFVALEPKAIGIGFTEDSSAPGVNQSLNFSFGFQLDTNPADNVELVPINTVFSPINESQEWFYEITLGTIAFASFTPDWHVAIWLSEAGDLFPAAGTGWNIDFTIYGINSTTNVSVNLMDKLGTANILTFTLYAVALLSFIAAAAIWPTTSTDDMEKAANRMSRRGGR